MRAKIRHWMGLKLPSGYIAEEEREFSVWEIMKLFEDGSDLPDRPCCSLDSTSDARRVADGVVVTRGQRRDQCPEVGDVHRLEGREEPRVLERERELSADAAQKALVRLGEGVAL